MTDAVVLPGTLDESAARAGPLECYEPSRITDAAGRPSRGAGRPG